jgi:FtsK/SpoIIIE family
MTKISCLNFQLTLRSKVDKFARNHSNSILLVRRAINSICGNFADKQVLSTTQFTIRYLKDENNASAVNTYFCISRSEHDFSSEEVELIQLNIEATLGTIFKTSLCQLDWQQRICTDAISQIVKDEFFDLSNNLYVPRFLKASNAANFYQVINFMESKDSKIALEVYLQPYYALEERERWLQGIEQVIQKIQLDSNSRSSFGHALADYQEYKKYYSRDTTLPYLFNYSVRAYGEKQSHVQALLSAFRDSAISQDDTADCLVINLPSQSSSLTKIGSTEALQRPEWQNTSLVNTPIQKIVETNKTGWGKFGNGSLDIDNWLATGIGLQQIDSSNPRIESLPQQVNLTQSSQDQLVLSQSGQVTKKQAPAPITIFDLKPLHKIACLEEIQGFFGLEVSEKIGISYPTMTAEEIFDLYKHLITRDTYIIGIDDECKPITSSWDETPHRLLAGVPGAGKTNFLRWLLFQFLYANPKRKVYITDFKGLDFQFIKNIHPYTDISITIESCQEQAAKIHQKEFLMRQELMSKRNVTKLSTLRKELQKYDEEDVDRTLWLIDEAADISFASGKVRTEIENSLTKYARQGRSFGIQVVYCTQRVSSAIITPQVIDQCEEKVIFRVATAASTIVLDNPIASEIPMNAKGRAVLDSPQGRIFINTPFMQSPEGSEIPISATLWKHLQR